MFRHTPFVTGTNCAGDGVFVVGVPFELWISWPPSLEEEPLVALIRDNPEAIDKLGIVVIADGLYKLICGCGYAGLNWIVV